MFLALCLAVGLLTLSVLLLFVWPIMLAGPGFRLRALMSPEARFLGGSFATVLGMVALAPLATTAVGSGGETLVQIAQSIAGLEFDL